MEYSNYSSQQQIQTFGDILASNNAKVIINQFSTTYQVISSNEVKNRPLNQVSPYVGLKKFEAKDRDLFFGRDQLVLELINEIAVKNLILLLGASGSGKSSIVRAGLIPRIRSMLGTKFVDLILTPDRDPFLSFQSTLNSQGYRQSATEILLNTDPKDVSKVVQELKGENEQWLIFVDQFEEIFTACKNTAIHRNFIDSLILLTKRFNDSIKVCIAMRSDFLDKLSPYPELGRDNMFLGDMQADELRLAIAQPAAKHGVVFEEDLVEQIIQDIQGQAGSLPLLQYTLDLLWQRSDIQNRVLRIQTYRERGTVRDALQRRVDEIYSGFTLEQQNATRKIFLRLVDIDRSEVDSSSINRAISRRAYLSEFTDELTQYTLQQLVNANLLIANHSLSPTVEVAHEILLSSWTSLRDWIRDAQDSIVIRNRLADDTQRWKQFLRTDSIKAEEELWSGSKLERVLEFRQDQLFELLFGGLSDDQNDFIDTSVEMRDRVLKRELELLETVIDQEKKARKEAELKTRFAISATGFALIALIIGGFTWWQHQWSLQVFQDLFTGVDVKIPELSNALDDLLEHANMLREKGDVDRAIAYYRRILTEVNKLKNGPESEALEFHKISNEVESYLVQLIENHRISKLEEQLRNREIGHLRTEPDLQFTEFENQYTEGALRTTYNILMYDVGADLNKTGRLENPEEADRMPCEILQKIDKIWRELTHKTCGWYGLDFDPYITTDCPPLQNQSLTIWIFSPPYNVVVDRLNACLIPISKNDESMSQ